MSCTQGCSVNWYCLILLCKIVKTVIRATEHCTMYTTVTVSWCCVCCVFEVQMAHVVIDVCDWCVRLLWQTNMCNWCFMTVRIVVGCKCVASKNNETTKPKNNKHNSTYHFPVHCTDRTNSLPPHYYWLLCCCYCLRRCSHCQWLVSCRFRRVI